VFIGLHGLLHQHAIFHTRSGSLKSGYRFVQTISFIVYRLTSVVCGNHAPVLADFGT